MDAKRAIAVVIAFLVGVAVGLAALYELRTPPRTVVDPIEIEGDPPGNRGRGSPKGTRAGDRDKADKKKRTRRSDDRDAPAPAPAPQPPPPPPGDDDDDDDDDGGGDDSGDDDGGGDD